jgi:hypothetical protein
MSRTVKEVNTEMCTRLEQIDQLSKRGAVRTTSAHDRKEIEDDLAKQWEKYWELIAEGGKLTALAHSTT